MRKANGSPFRRLSHPPVQQQLDMLMRGIDQLTHHLSECELRIEFAMRQIQLGRKIPGALVDANGRVPTEQVSLLHLYHANRDAFAERLMKEHHARARAQQAASAQGDGDPGDPGDDAAIVEDGAADPDHPTGLVIVPGATDH